MLGEIGVRLVPAQGVIIEDPLLGWVLQPGWFGWHTAENRVWVTINDQGLFDHDHPVQKPAGTRRVAVVGDSFLSAFNVPLSRTFVTRLEENLRQCRANGAGPIDAINFGVGGYGTAQELLTYRAKVRRYTPDVVVLVAYLGNDIVNNHPRLNPQGRAPYFKLVDGDLLFEPMPPIQPFEILDAIEPRHEDLPWYQRMRIAITDRSTAASLAYGLWGAYRNRGKAAPPHPEPRPGAVYRPPRDQDMADAWRVTEALVERLGEEVAADGAEFLLVTAPTAEQADGRPEVRRAVAARFGADTVDYADRRLIDFASSRGIAAISLLAPLTEYAERHHQNLYGGYATAAPAGTGHWNEWGNRVAARAVSERLCAEIVNN